MPEKPEVITVARKLSTKLIDKRIVGVKVFYNNIIEYPSLEEFKERIVNQQIHEISTRGKWIVVTLDDYYLLVHLRMEGKFFFRTEADPKGKHEHVFFDLDNGTQLRYADVRKFGKMMLIEKSKIYSMKPYTELGLEPWDKELTSTYLKEKFNNKSLPIKSVLLDQSIIAGIGNIYADEILFLSKINPLKSAKELTDKNRKDIIKNTIKVLDEAVLKGGTTIRSYTSEEGVTGIFQNDLYVHQRAKEPCKICKNEIIKTRVGGRGTYYCPKCQR